MSSDTLKADHATLSGHGSQVLEIDALKARRGDLARLWLSAASVAGLGTWICMFARPGINWGVWTLAATVGLLMQARRGGKRITLDVWTMMALACVLAFGAAVTANNVLYPLILISTAALLALSLVRLSGTPAAAIDLRAMVLSPMLAGFATVMETGRRTSEGATLARAERSLPLLRGLLIAAPIVVVFALLLSGADPALAAWRDQIGEAIDQMTFLPRTVFFGALGTLVLGAYGRALRQPGDLNAIYGHTGARRELLKVGGTERLIVLGSVALLFALFLLMQMRYLFGDAAAIAGNGVTYADAARHGFAELSVVATLCMLLIAFLDRSAVPGLRDVPMRALSITVILETQLLLQSAYHRVSLYETAYGYTVSRVYAQVYMVVMSLALLLLAVEVWGGLDFARFTRRVATLAAAALAVMVYWNHDAWVAKANIDRYRATGQVDAYYLAHELSDDALPTLRAHEKELPVVTLPDSSAATLPFATLLKDKASRRERFRDGRAWYEFNARVRAAERALR
jgi:hypothetical protein